ncbi:(2Fe-2S)-binding protein [Acuticoccus mangrovi]|uniref:(2Fe-2S)-binding protein n=1 Tax=Acuticoccus mangrovi TaxID=2796142 RepID=A0A934IMG2_9HYPH|nr:(2Fe-2S)-binding protein [Acuticoccus mangrovi]MBJ3774600.1 (2Fe-2S)-binding protein [Acuticoccus mangrovi]
MIVCHCNVIVKAEIEDAVRRILAEDPAGRLEPQYVYRELQKRGRCCGCFPSVNRIVDELLAEAMKEVDGTTFGRVSMGGHLLPKD